MRASGSSLPSSAASSRAGVAWQAFCVALALHVTDEALTGFLSVYNPTILAFRPHGWWFPPTFAFRNWRTGLLLPIVVLLTIAPAFVRCAGCVRQIGCFLSL